MRVKLNLETNQATTTIEEVRHYFARHGELNVLDVKLDGISYIVDMVLSPMKLYRLIETIWQFCHDYNQDCVAIAIYDNDGKFNHGILSGPRADAWRPFDMAYFKE